MTENKEKTAVDITNLQYNEAPVTFDAEKNTLFIPQNLNKENWDGRILAKRGTLYFIEDDYFAKKEEAIRSGHSFEMIVLQENSYSECYVVFTGMPVMNLHIEDSSMEDDTEVMHATVQVYDPYHTSTEFQSAECSFNIRGGTSRSYPKVSYKLELKEEKLSFLGMKKDNDWILNALYDDLGLAHNKLSYRVWREIANYNQVKNDEGTTAEYIELFIDNEYCGVYELTERIDGNELSLGRNDVLYKCRATRIPQEHNYSNEDTDGMKPIFVLKYPKNYATEDWEPLKKWVNCFLKEEMNTYEEGAALLNMENAVDFTLYTLLIGGSDNLRKNVFFAAEYQNDGSYQFIKVPWDLNATWGNPWLDFEDSNYTLYDSEEYKNVTEWVTDMSTLYYYDEAKVSGMLYERWEELRQAGVITQEKIFEMLNEEFSYLYASGAYDRNYERWPHGKEYWQDEYIYEYVENRIPFLDNYFEQLYIGNTSPVLYDGVDYSSEFEARYYWETNYEILSEIYTYDRQTLLEHYVLYGKPYGLKGKKIITKSIGGNE